MTASKPEPTPSYIIRDISRKASDDIIEVITRNASLTPGTEAHKAISIAYLRAAMMACIEVHLLAKGLTSIGSASKQIGIIAVSIITQMADAGLFVSGEKDGN
ncbi:MAG: hypothetical protein ACEQSB_07200 [Undibacterium sp.]